MQTLRRSPLRSVLIGPRPAPGKRWICSVSLDQRSSKKKPRKMNRADQINAPLPMKKENSANDILEVPATKAVKCRTPGRK